MTISLRKIFLAAAVLAAALLSASLVLAPAPAAADYAGKFLRYNEKIYPQVTPPPPKTPGPASIRVPILVYHSVMPHHPGQTALQRDYDVDPAIFDRQMKFLKDGGYSVVPLADVYRHLADGTPLPEKAAVITFDDGWENQYVYALPVLEKYGYTATFFVYTDAIGRKKFMSWLQILDLKAKGMTIGSHTRRHPLLTKITDQARLRDEIVESKVILEGKLGGTVDLFAYPFGVGAGDPAVLALVKQAGYKAARIFQGGLWNDSSDIYALRSVKVTDQFSLFQSYFAPEPAKK